MVTVMRVYGSEIRGWEWQGDYQYVGERNVGKHR